MGDAAATIPPPAAVPTGPTRDHASYMGASDASALVGAHPYKTALDIWAAKTRRVVWEDDADPFTLEALEAGDHFERPILELYLRKLLRDGGADSALEFTGTLFHPEFAHVGATPDAIRDRSRTVQVKLVGYHQAFRWGDPQDGPEGVPDELVPQVHQEAALARIVLGIPAEVADVVAQIGTERRVYEIPIDHELGESLITIADDFWTRHVANDLMPEVTEGGELDTLRAIYPRIRAGAKVQLAPPEVVELALRYDELRAQGKSAADAKGLVGARLCAMVGDGAGFVDLLKGIRVSWPERAGKVSWKDVAEDYRRLLLAAGTDSKALAAIESKHEGEPTRSIDVRVKGT